MAVYQSDPRRAADEDFEPGRLEHLAPGNLGRLLDPRRTPLRVLGVEMTTGLVRLRVEAFEDAGAIWRLPAERVDHLQFPPRSARLAAADVRTLQAAVRRLDRTEHRPRDDSRSDWAEQEIARLAAAAAPLLPAVSARPDLSDPATVPALADAAARWWRERDVADVEARFARAWASNPESDETVKAQLLVLAGLGLADYRGPVLRDPAQLRGRESAERRERHLLARLAFVRAMLAAAGLPRLVLYRGYALAGPWQQDRPASLISATADRAVAMAHFDADTPAAVLQRADIAAGRVLMTWLETPELAHPYRESEVVLLPAEPGTALF